MDIFDIVDTGYYYRDRSTAALSAARATTKSQNAEDEVRRLNRRIDVLCLLNQTLWEIVRERTKLTDEDFLKKVSEIDGRDGAVDGKMGGVQRCAECDRPLNPKHKKCLYCGEEQDKDHVFDIK